MQSQHATAPTGTPLALTADLAPSPSVSVRRWQYGHPGRHGAAATAHPGIEISWVAAGRVGFQFGRRSVDLCPGQTIVVPDEVEHACLFRGHSDGRSIKLSRTLLDRVAGSIGVEPAVALGLITPKGRTSELAQLIYREAREQAPAASLMVETLAEALAIELVRTASAGTDAPTRLSLGRRCADPRIAAAQRAIERRHSEALSVDDLARAAGMSRFHFSRRFRDATGKSPYGYLVETRLRHAAALLRHGDCNVTEAALAVGFNELGRFSRKFRELMGISPAAYRRAQRRA